MSRGLEMMRMADRHRKRVDPGCRDERSSLDRIGQELLAREPNGAAVTVLPRIPAGLDDPPEAMRLEEVPVPSPGP